MGVPNDDVVLIQSGKEEGDPCVITVNCPDKTGLGCDLCRIILEFGLCIAKGGSDSPSDSRVSEGIDFLAFVGFYSLVL